MKMTQKPLPTMVDLGPNAVVIDVSISDQYIVCVTDQGQVYSWGKNTGQTIQV